MDLEKLMEDIIPSHPFVWTTALVSIIPINYAIEHYIAPLFNFIYK